MSTLHKNRVTKIITKAIITIRKKYAEYKSPPGSHLEFQSRDHSICHMLFPIGGPLEPSLSPPVFEIFGPRNINERMNQRTNQQTQRIA